MLWSLWISETLPCIFYIKPLICLLSKSNKSFKWSLHNEIIIRLFVCRWIINQFNVKKKIWKYNKDRWQIACKKWLILITLNQMTEILHKSVIK